jgi:tetratricopeptide (TPR) repeat protein
LNQNLNQKALEACNHAIGFYPNEPDINLLKIQILSSFGNNKEALDLADKMITLNPANNELKMVKANLLLNLDEVDEAITLFKEVLPATDEKYEVCYQLGNAYQKQNNFALAIKYYEKAIDLESYFQEYYVELIFCYSITAQLEEKIPFFLAIIDKDAFAEVPWYALGLAYSKLNKWPEAIDALEYAVAIEPNYYMAWLQKGHAHMNSEAFFEAQKAYLEADKVGIKSADLYCHIAASFEDTENYKKAIEYYKKALELDQKCHEALFGLASCLGSIDRYLEAIHYLRMAIKQQPNSSYYWLELAENEAKLGNEVSAEEAYEKAISLQPSNIDAYICLAMFYYNLSDFVRAIDVMDRAIEEDPEEAEYYYRQVILYYAAGQLKEAINYLELALNINYDGHIILWEYFSELKVQKVLFKIIDQYKPEDDL